MNDALAAILLIGGYILLIAVVAWVLGRVYQDE